MGSCFVWRPCSAHPCPLLARQRGKGLFCRPAGLYNQIALWLMAAPLNLVLLGVVGLHRTVGRRRFPAALAGLTLATALAAVLTLRYQQRQVGLGSAQVQRQAGCRPPRSTGTVGNPLQKLFSVFIHWRASLPLLPGWAIHFHRAQPLPPPGALQFVRGFFGRQLDVGCSGPHCPAGSQPLCNFPRHTPWFDLLPSRALNFYTGPQTCKARSWKLGLGNRNGGVGVGVPVCFVCWGGIGRGGALCRRVWAGSCSRRAAAAVLACGPAVHAPAPSRPALVHTCVRLPLTAARTHLPTALQAVHGFEATLSQAEGLLTISGCKQEPVEYTVVPRTNEWDLKTRQRDGPLASAVLGAMQVGSTALSEGGVCGEMRGWVGAWVGMWVGWGLIARLRLALLFACQQV